MNSEELTKVKEAAMKTVEKQHGGIDTGVFLGPRGNKYPAIRGSTMEW